MAEVTLRGVSKRFGASVALDDVSLDIGDGDFVVLLGPTGAGKTTTLRLIAGLERQEAGEIRIGGYPVDDLTPAQRDVAMVFQAYSLYPHMSVRQNLAFPLKSPLLNWSAADIERKVAEVAEVLQISHKLDNKATALSGGEMQRVSIGRALVRDPAIYLMDEPLSSLDAKLRSELRVELKRVQSDLGATVLYVTHDQVEAMSMATTIGVLDAGRLVQAGTPRDIYENPSSLHVASRLGLPRINTLPVEVFGHAPTGAATMALRPEHIVESGARAPGGSTDAERESLPGTVTRVEHLGDQTRLHLALGEHEIVTLADAHTPHRRGDTVHVRPENPLFFDASGARVV